LQAIGIMLLHNYTKDSIPFSEGYIHTTACHFLNRERMGSTHPCSEEYKIRVSLLQTIGIMLLLNYTKDSIPFSERYIQLLIIFLDRERMGSILVQKNKKLGFFCCKSCFFSIIQRTQFLSQKDTYTTACHFLNRERMDSILPCSEAYNWRRFLHHA